MVGVIISLLVTIMVVVILLKKMKAQFVLFFGGLTLLVCSIAMDAFGLLPNGAQILPKGVASTGFIGFDPRRTHGIFCRPLSQDSLITADL